MSSKTSALFVVILTAGLAVLPSIVEGQVPGDESERVFQLPWGEPDLQGIWTSATLTPLERPAQQSEKVELTNEEVRSIEQQSEESRIASDGKSAPGSVGGYNQVWLDAGTQIVEDRRTSLIVDPPTGVIPWKHSAKL